MALPGFVLGLPGFLDVKMLVLASLTLEVLPSAKPQRKGVQVAVEHRLKVRAR